MIYNKENCLTEFREKLEFLDNNKNSIISAAQECIKTFVEFYYGSEYGKNIIKNYESFAATFGHFVDSNISHFLTDKIGLKFNKTGKSDADIVCENGQKIEVKIISTNGVITDKKSKRLYISIGAYTKFSSHINVAYNGGVYKSVDCPYIVIQINQPYDILCNFIENKQILLSRIYIGYFKQKDFIGSTSSSYIPAEKYVTQGYDIYFDESDLNDIRNQVDEYNKQFPTKHETIYQNYLERFNKLTIYEKANLQNIDKTLYQYAIKYKWLDDPEVIELKNKIKQENQTKKELEYVKILIDFIKENGSIKGFSQLYPTQYNYFRQYELFPEVKEYGKKNIGNMIDLCKINGDYIF